MTLARPVTVVIPALAALLMALVAIGTGRGLAAALAVVAAGFGIALARQASRYETAMEAVADAGELALTLAPGLLIVYFGFNGGGFAAAPVAFVAVVLAIVLALRMAFASEPLAGLGPLALVAAGLLALYTLWTALSTTWSHAPGRALLEADRALMYLLALLVFASFTRSTDRLRLMVRGIAGGAFAVCAIGLVTRVLPDVWPIAPDLQQGRLSYPLTYWNALGLLAALGLVLCVHLACSEREPRAARVLGAAAAPVLATALFFTFSRGSIGAALLGTVAYVLLARPRGLLGGLLALLPATAIAIVVAYGADLLASDNPTSAAAAAQGHRVALAVALCAAGAAGVRALTLPLDAALARVRLPPRARRWVPAAAWTLGALLALAVFAGIHGPRLVSHNYDRFVKGNAVVQTGDLRSRLGDPGNNRRIDQWKVAWKGYRSERFRGLGAGTYENLWNQRRPVRFAILDAHSLYVEVLAELGIAGLALLGGALLLVAYAFARGLWRGRDRYPYAALLAAFLAWAVHAGIDWDWEMPAVTVWVFVAGGAALAASARSRRRRLRLATLPRLGLALACLAVALVPAAIAVSEHRLTVARAAFARADCATASREAQRALDVVAFRPEPRELLAYCAARGGRLRAALSWIRVAVQRDPGNWRYRYDEALVLAAGGRDPARAAQAAVTLNPLEPTAAVARRILTSPKGEAIAREQLTAGR